MSDCIFCKMVNKEIPADIVYEDEQILAFKDINPQAPVHILLIPKKHMDDISAMDEQDMALIGKIHLVAADLARQMGIDQSGFRLLTNCKKDSGQEVPHLHFHLIGGVYLGAFTNK
ncbi:MAG: histidine triad nucleotide-binding protein [Clostridiales bacterium]